MYLLHELGIKMCKDMLGRVAQIVGMECFVVGVHLLGVSA